MTLTELIIGAACILGAAIASATLGIVALALIEITTSEWEDMSIEH